MAVKTVWFPAFEKTLPPLAGKCVVITGTTSGTGKVAALTCAKLGARVLLLNRESQRSQEALQAVKSAHPTAVVDHVPCDLMSFDSVLGASAQVKSMVQDGIDVLCCNAGIMNFPDEATADGYDVQVQTNHLSHFLLVRELLPCVQAAAKLRGEARIVNHSSLARQGSPLDAKYFGKNGGKLGGSGFERYHHTKLANAVFTFALEAKLQAAGHGNVKVVTAAPGVSDTALFDESLPKCLNCLKACIMQSAEDGTMPLLTCMFKEDVQSGDFIEPSGASGRKGPPHTLRRPLTGKDAVVGDVGSQGLLWQESEKAVGEFQIQ